MVGWVTMNPWKSWSVPAYHAIFASVMLNNDSLDIGGVKGFWTPVPIAGLGLVWPCDDLLVDILLLWETPCWWQWRLIINQFTVEQCAI